MSFKVKFWNFSKRVNSTAVPNTTATEYMCVVKTETSLINPTLELNYGLANAPQFNYCQIPDFGNRYYWVREWHFSERLWSCELEIDPLGSFKSEIGSSSFYVTRAASDSDPYIVDVHYPMMGNASHSITSAGSAWFTSVNTLSSGSFILGLRGRINSSQTAGGVTYLVMTPAQFKSFTDDLFNGTLNNYVLGTPLDISDTLGAMIFNPTQYIASCIWLPGTPTAETPANGFNIGWWGFTSGAKILSDMDALIYTTTLTLPNHPQRTANTKYLNGNPFTSRWLYLPRFGVVDISDKLPANATSLIIELVVDPITGQGLYNIYYKVENVTYQYQIDVIQCQIGVEMPLSSNQVTMAEAVSAALSPISAVADIFKLNAAGAASDIGSFYSVLQPHINDISKASGFLGYSASGGTVFCVSRFNLTVNRDVSEDGYPLCKVKQISTLSGYFQCLHGDIAIASATRYEMDQINQYLESGMFYE